MHRRMHAIVRTKSLRVLIPLGFAASVTAATLYTSYAKAEQLEDVANQLKGKTHFTLEQLKEKGKQFLDKYPDGMDIDTFTHVTHSHSKEEAMLTFHAIDTDHNGVIDVKEYLVYNSIAAAGTPEERLDYQFHLYDLDNNGYVTVDEIEEVLRLQVKYSKISLAGLTHYHSKFGRPSSVPEVAFTILNLCDTNVDHKVSREEFPCLIQEIVKIQSYKPPESVEELLKTRHSEHHPKAHTGSKFTRLS